ncbi:helix-turn-helix transcriptional regulator [Christensenellaceae bacterium NSJ-63]|uniref:Helix-turn-helix transcriptional regulator n=1 Tax=Guopingia tenuis TaxID=2763656 RepID=A0A926HXC0_9FIRM|nr:helix-turn-helix transcriptional regulator [Guopingia tenuis]MBC8539208.1 helix-turn-helix transcriptional regulator [Guopingia tenuis]
MKEINYIQIGQKIKKLRNQAGLTQEQMAEMCEISTSFLGHIERGTRKLSLETAVKIADCLHVSMDALIMDGALPATSILPSIESILQKQDKSKQEQVLRLFKVLCENIDKL